MVFVLVDTRFFSFAGPTPLGALLAALGLTLDRFDGDGPLIAGAEELGLAGPEHISLAAQVQYLEALRKTGAGAVIVSQDLLSEVPSGTIAVVAKNPHLAFVELLDRLYPQDTRGTVLGLLGPHDSLPMTENDVRLGPGVALGPGVVFGCGFVFGPFL